MTGTVHYRDDQITLHHGDALEVARTLPSGSVQTIVTSPPYFGLRDYGEDGQIGAEASVGEYVDGMVTLFRELRRLLADDGTLWLNLGDTYASRWASVRSTGRENRGGDRTRATRGDMPEKNLLGVPWRVAFALQDDGWILRSDVIWSKPNPMPEPVTDRPTRAHEYLFMFAKSRRYYYDAAAIAEPDGGRSSGNGFSRPERVSLGGDGQDIPWEPGAGRNKRDVWTVATVPFGEAHFAVYPPELIRPCIRAGSRIGDTVLDPFSGSGTTGQVALYEGRKYIGIDLSKDYLDLSLRTRFQQPTLALGGIA